MMERSKGRFVKRKGGRGKERKEREKIRNVKEIRLKSEQDREGRGVRAGVCCFYFHPLKIDIYMDKGVCSNRKLTESVYDERRKAF